MYNLYLITYKHDNGNVISQFLVTAKTKEGAMETVEKKYKVDYYSMTYKLVCPTSKEVDIQVV